jgi:hypothetical protein
MKILKEKKFYAFRWTDADENIALAFLEDGTWLLVHKDGYAVAPDGTKYYHVAREVQGPPLSPDPPWLTDDPDPQPIPDTVLEDLGWTTDAAAPMFFPVGSDTAIESTRI